MELSFTLEMRKLVLLDRSKPSLALELLHYPRRAHPSFCRQLT
jgi:hypothetical protein